MHFAPIPRKPRLRRVFAAGRTPRRRPALCADTHRGPFTRADEYGEWVMRLSASVGLTVQPTAFVCCGCCGSHIALPAGRTVSA